MDKILFLCTGNTCRSPMAQGFFLAQGGEEKLGLTAESAGLFTADGLPASANAVTAAAALGADISAHRSRRLTPELAAAARYLVCMTAAHCDRLAEAYPACADKLRTLSEKDIDDPFGGDLELYQRAAEQINAAIKKLISQLEPRR